MADPMRDNAIIQKNNLLRSINLMWGYTPFSDAPSYRWKYKGNNNRLFLSTINWPT